MHAQGNLQQAVRAGNLQQAASGGNLQQAVSVGETFVKRQAREPETSSKRGKICNKRHAPETCNKRWPRENLRQAETARRSLHQPESVREVLLAKSSLCFLCSWEVTCTSSKTHHYLNITENENYLNLSGLCRTLKLWDIKTRACLHTFEGHKDAVLAVTVKFLNLVAFRCVILVSSYSSFLKVTSSRLVC